MLSMNNFADNKQQIAQTKLTQVDSALRSWGKAVTAIGETGVGATATISSDETLQSSLMEYFNAKSIDNNGAIILENGAQITADYTLGDNGVGIGNLLGPNSALATIKVTVPNANKDEADFSEEYILQADKLSSLDDLLEGFTKVPVVTKGSQKLACLDLANCVGKVKDENGNDITCKDDTYSSYCTELDLDENNKTDHIWVKNDSLS